MTPAVFDWLSNDAAVTAIVGEQIYSMGIAPQNTQGDYITWSVVGGHAESYLSERPGIDQDLVQIDCWSMDEARCTSLMKAVVHALETHGYMSGAPDGSREEDTELFRYMLQFYFWTPR